VTQLVVRKDARRRGLATQLLSTAIHLHPDVVAWGLATFNPHSVKALERASQRRCDLTLTSLHARPLIESSRIPYFTDNGCETTIDGGRSLIHSRFFLDHTQVDAYRRELGEDWRQGVLGEGDEYFAFIFKQSPLHV